jgi:hypothetical protein
MKVPVIHMYCHSALDGAVQQAALLIRNDGYTPMD